MATVSIKRSSILNFACAVFIIYYTLVSVIWPVTNGLLIPLCGMMVLLIFVDLVLMRHVNLYDLFDFPIRCWLVFGLIALLVAPFVALKKSMAIDSTLTFLKLVLMCFSIIYIGKRNKNISFFVFLMYITSLIYVLYMYLSGNLIGGRLALVNANGDANVCLIGIVTASLLIGVTKNRFYKLFILLSCVLFLFVNLMTGSRKSLLCSLFYIMFWIVVDYKTTWKTIKTHTKVFIVFLSLAVIGLFIIYGIPIFMNSTTFLRFSDAHAMQSDSGRVELYREGWRHFVSNPIFGIGFNQFRVYNSRGLYSHSTYTEILANTGIVGTILFFAPHVWCLKWLMFLSRNSKSYNQLRDSLLLLVYMISSLILAFGMSQLNNERVLMMYSLMFAYIMCERARRTNENN